MSGIILTVINGISRGAVSRLEEGVHTLGRHPDAALWLRDGSVSGTHAILSWVGNECWHLQDQDSTNGTFLDGKRLNGTPRILPRSGALRLGNIEVAFSQEEKLTKGGSAQTCRDDDGVPTRLVSRDTLQPPIPQGTAATASPASSPQRPTRGTAQDAAGAAPRTVHSGHLGDASLHPDAPLSSTGSKPGPPSMQRPVDRGHETLVPSAELHTRYRAEQEAMLAELAKAALHIQQLRARLLQGAALLEPLGESLETLQEALPQGDQGRTARGALLTASLRLADVRLLLEQAG